jgi:carbamoyl-phosphate synthase large subunit
VIGTDSSAIRLHLSPADDRLVLPRADDPAFRDALMTVTKRWDVDVIHAQPDAEVLAVGAIREELPAATYLPSQEALITAADKAVFACTMNSAHIPVPASARFTDLDSVGDVTTDLLSRFDRVWLRASTGAGARASLPVRSPAAAFAWVQWWVSERDMLPSDFMVSEFLPGREFAYQSIWQEGELVTGQARERLEYLYGHLTPHGQTSTPAVARTIKLPAVDEIATGAIRALDAVPCGVYGVDMKEAEDRTIKVTEINAGRFFTTSNFFAAAGLNMPDILVRCALGERPPRLGSSPLPPDLHWIRMVDMGYILVRGDELDPWPRSDS